MGHRAVNPAHEDVFDAEHFLHAHIKKKTILFAEAVSYSGFHNHFLLVKKISTIMSCDIHTTIKLLFIMPGGSDSTQWLKHGCIGGVKF